MQITRLTENWSRWAGGMSDIEDASRTASAYLAKWTGAEPPVRVVAAMPRRVEEADGLEQSRALIDDRDLALIESLKIEIGAFTGPRVTIHAERRSAPALALEVSGDDKVQVTGLYAEVRSKLDRGRQRLDSNLTALALLVALFGAIVAGLYIDSSLGWLTDTPDTPSSATGSAHTSLAWQGIVVLLALVVPVVWITLRALPNVEILPQGRGSALERWRTRIGGVVVAIVVGVLASGIWGAFGH